MHNAAYEEMGLDWCYVAMPCDSQDLEKVTKALRFLDFKGLNITIPHKQEVLTACNKLTEIANFLHWWADIGPILKKLFRYNRVEFETPIIDFGNALRNAWDYEFEVSDATGEMIWEE